VADPDISPAGGTFTMMPNVVMSCATTGALIHYTIDGDDPTEDDPALTNGQSMIVPWTTTVNAAAFDDAILRPSDVQSAAFTIIHPLVAGRKHTMILNPDETILAAGSNGSGQLGDGTTTDRTNLVGVLNLTNAVGLGAMTPMASWAMETAAGSSPARFKSPILVGLCKWPAAISIPWRWIPAATSGFGATTAAASWVTEQRHIKRPRNN
jgi:hypothetical protein